MNVAVWLAGLGLERYAQSFADHGVDGTVLTRLDADDLRQIGVLAVGHRRLVLDAIAMLRNQPTAGAMAAARPGPTGRASWLSGERRQLTVMFVDIVGFTALSSRLDPEELREVLRTYQNAMAGEVARFEGIVAKFLGDGVLAYFGFPLAHEDNAERAVCAGLAITEAAKRLRTPDGGTLGVRIGIATGLVVIGGLMDTDAAWEPAAVGETPNLAARLQALAYPGSVVIAHCTRQLTGGLFDYADLGLRPIKGFAEPVRAWRVIGRSGTAGRFEARQVGALAPLVGRATELERLQDRWLRARDRTGQVVLLSGEPGIGKSRLLKAFLDRLPAEACMRLHFRCSPLQTTTPLYPVIDQLERSAGFARDDSVEQRLDKLEAMLSKGIGQLATTTPLVAALLSLPSAGRYPPLQLAAATQRDRTQDVLLGQLEALAHQRPMLVVFEDAHWCDPTTLDIVGQTMDRLRGWPLLMVVTYRPEFVPPWPAAPHVIPMILNRLGTAESRAVVRGLDAAGALSAEAVDQVVERADGIPLFLEELTKAVLESALPSCRERTTGRDGPLPDFLIPASLQDSLVARLDRLAPVREVAQTAACLGREFSHAVLAAVSPLPTAQLDEALRRLVDAELLYQIGTPPEARYSFKHALVRDVAYATMLNSRRQRLHARIVSVLEAQFPAFAANQPQILAQHCAEAGLLSQAIEYWRQAGLAAARHSAMREAEVLLRRGLELAALLPDTPERAVQELDLQVALGATLLAAKGESAPEIGEAYRRARVLYERTGNLAVEPAVLWGVWHFHMNQAQLDLAREVAVHHVHRARARQSVVGEAVAHRCRLVVDLFAGEFEAALQHWVQLRALPPPVEGCPQEILLDPWITARSMASWATLLQGQKSLALASGGEALAAARKSGQPYMLAVVLHHQNVLAQLLGDRQTLATQTAELLALARQHGFAHWLATATLLHGWAIASDDALEAGLASMQRGLEAKKATGSRLKIPYYLGLMAGLLGSAGRSQEGLGLLDEALGRIEATGERWFEAELHRIRGDLLLDLRPEQAAACYAKALEVARRQQAGWWERRVTRSLAATVRAA